MRSLTGMDCLLQVPSLCRVNASACSPAARPFSQPVLLLGNLTPACNNNNNHHDNYNHNNNNQEPIQQVRLQGRQRWISTSVIGALYCSEGYESSTHRLQSCLATLVD